jgi:hypothetical protein
MLYIGESVVSRRDVEVRREICRILTIVCCFIGRFIQVLKLPNFVYMAGEMARILLKRIHKNRYNKNRAPVAQLDRATDF